MYVKNDTSITREKFKYKLIKIIECIDNKNSINQKVKIKEYKRKKYEGKWKKRNYPSSINSNDNHPLAFLRKELQV